MANVSAQAVKELQRHFRRESREPDQPGESVAVARKAVDGMAEDGHRGAPVVAAFGVGVQQCAPAIRVQLCREVSAGDPFLDQGRVELEGCGTGSPSDGLAGDEAVVESRYVEGPAPYWTPRPT